MEERRKELRREADRELVDAAIRMEEQLDRRSSGEGKEAKRNRRRAIRHNCSVIIKVLPSGAGASDSWQSPEPDLLGRVLDLSTDGASVFTSKPFDAGQNLGLQIKTREGVTLKGKGQVRWVKSVPEKRGFATGVQFEDLSEAESDAINEFLASLDATAGL